MGRPLAFVIEDQKPLAQAYGDALELIGYSSELFFTGQKALDAFKDASPDIVILDMNLPEVSGHYIYKHIRSQARLDSTPVIVATANSLMASAIEKELEENDHVLIKPVSLMELQGLVKRLRPATP